MSYGRKRPARKCFPEKLMAHFLGAVREIRTSGWIPSWLGSSTSQPEEDRNKRSGMRGVGAVITCCPLRSHSVGCVFAVWWAHTEPTIAWVVSSTCACRLGKRLPGSESQGSEGAARRPIYHVVFLSLRPDIHGLREHLPDGTSTLTMDSLICFRVTRIPE